MKIINSVLSFLKKLFNKATKGECIECVDRTICQTTDKNKRYAVIIGVENSKWGACPGSIKDSNMMFDMISQYTSNIVKLNDKQATVENVRRALNECVSKVPEDGICYIAYSGHGGQMNASSTAKMETDGKDEFLCLYDNYLIDNDLWTIFNKCKGKVFVVFDCCHSSTMFSLDSENKNDNVEDWELIEHPFFQKYENVRAALRMFVISGCGEETVSWGSSQGGNLTNAMKKSFNKCLTYSEWWSKIRVDQSFKSVKQVPIATRIGAFDLNAKIFN